MLQKELVSAARYQIDLRRVLFVLHDLLFDKSHRGYSTGVFLNYLNRLIIVFRIVDLNQLVPRCRGKEVAALILLRLVVSKLILVWRDLSRIVERKYLILMGLDTVNFIYVRGFKVVNSYIAVPITTRNLLAIV